MRDLNPVGVLLELHGVPLTADAAIGSSLVDKVRRLQRSRRCYGTLQMPGSGRQVSMHRGWIEAALLACLAIATAGAPLAQQRQASPRLETDPNLDAADQLAPSQMQQTLPPAVAEPSGGQRTHAATRRIDGTSESGAPAKPYRTANPHVVVCSGVFGPDSSHLKLAMAFHSKNVEFAQVDASSGAKVMASVLFTKDPSRRLEVWWSKPASRSDTHLIVINGRSEWTAPGELRLGLTLPDVEKLNGRPFRLSGFDRSGVATLSNWDGGGLAALPGGCKVGISLRPAPTATASAIASLPADREFSSGDGTLRAVNPTVSEILVAY
jgi:hypothetical protein